MNRRALAGRTVLLLLVASCLVLGLVPAIGCGGGRERRGADEQYGGVHAAEGYGRGTIRLGDTKATGTAGRHELVEGPPEADQSAGLFVGVARFGDRSIPDVLYACDDAIDLADKFIELGLLRPDAVALLLAGAREEQDCTPEKPESRARLAWLRSAGTRVTRARSSEIYAQAREMAQRVGRRGMLVFAFASHGYAIGGKHFILAVDSTRGDLDELEGVSIEGLMRASQLPQGARRLVFLDVCREQSRSDPPVGGASWPDPRAADVGGMLESLDGRYGVLSAASPGGVSLADPRKKNGIFTGALLDGLRCPAHPDPDGFLKFNSLAYFVIGEVDGRSGSIQKPEERVGGGLKDFALLRCGGRVGQILRPRRGATMRLMDEVEVEVLRKGFYVTAIIGSEDGTYFPQHLSQIVAPVELSDDLSLKVEFGKAGKFQIYVAFSEDPDFLHEEDGRSDLPVQDAAGRAVHWLGPVNVMATNS